MVRYNKGFTLIELLVVIAIIGILSSVVLASLNSAREKSRDAKRISDVKQLQLALELYFDAEGKYPNVTNLANSTLVADGYIAVIPTDPSSGAAYNYTGLNANCTSYHLGATLENADHVALDSDADLAANQTAASACTGSNSDFAGTDPVYDVRP